MSNVKYVKSMANITAILDSLNIIYHESSDLLRAPCPVHGGNNPNAWVINPQTGMWYCHTQCKNGSDIFGLVQQVKDLRFYEACQYIAKVSGLL